MSGIFLEYLKNVINGTGKDGNKWFESEQKDSEFFLESQIYGYKKNAGSYVFMKKDKIQRCWIIQ